MSHIHVEMSEQEHEHEYEHELFTYQHFGNERKRIIT